MRKKLKERVHSTNVYVTIRFCPRHTEMSNPCEGLMVGMRSQVLYTNPHNLGIHAVVKTQWDWWLVSAGGCGVVRKSSQRKWLLELEEGARAWPGVHGPECMMPRWFRRGCCTLPGIAWESFLERPWVEMSTRCHISALASFGVVNIDSFNKALYSVGFFFFNFF